MRTKIILLISMAITGTYFGASCDKNNGGTDVKELPDPIRITLRSAEEEMMRADQQFAFDFFANLFDEEAFTEDKNFMVSPLSLSMALAMTMNGAAGETDRVMKKTLQMDDYSKTEINSYYKKLKEALLKTDPTTKLSIANAIFANRQVAVHPDFIKTNQLYYDATVQPVDFSDATTTDIINKWASDQTHGLIRKVIERTNAQDLMYLLNALYFKGMWSTGFHARNTTQRPFTYENGARKSVDMMRQTAKFNYTENQNLQLVQLPYGNQAFSMMVLLPREGKKLKDVVTAARQGDYWSGLKSGLREAEVELFLPKFKTKYSKKLNDVLTRMGMGITFTDAADFSGISDIPARISFVKQDTYISTDESGTEAAAVTTVGMEMTSMPTQPKKVIFNAERPFIYIIQENSTGAILFMGAVKNFDE
ncbi:MAG: serpin family protein [Proteiniphilum sp.]|nr:serpin family protein [Proteiniphilum sp.]